MGPGRKALILIAVCIALSACNTTDALTPRVGIGEEAGDLRSSPVTQNEVERMAATAPRQPVYSQQSENPPSYDQGDQQSAGAEQGSTLDRQADALRSGGRNPEASAPFEGQGDVSEGPSSDAPVSRRAEQQEADRRLAGPDPQSPPQSPDEQPSQQQASLAPARDPTIRFLPIIGAPVEAVTPLSRQLGTEARSLGLSIRSSTDTSSSYILKGYLSAFEDGPAISVTYVWDVLDNSGARLHRIQGTESVPLKKGDPWTAVPASVMQQIARKTMAEFSSWRQTHGG